ncbi:MerR family transcriptional regulator [Kribbella sp. NPDC004875]|uniref:MerR family transcriptional regulator n=1 Tax=Kribbella sp. NPDC004875 TaxID=3364107 RepID=UPI0036CCFBB1
MARRSGTTQYTATGEVVWPVGRVAEMLGVPTVTIRSWERRYGIGPSLRSAGQHRRYSAEDVARLRQMIALIAGGTSPVDAARLSAPTGPAVSEPSALLSSAETYHVAAMADMLDRSIESRGIQRVWTEVVVPAFHELEQRFADAGDCIDLTVLLAGVVDEAIERYIVRRGLQHHGTPCLLVPCPDERHTLPLSVLRAVLLERGIPVIALAAGGNDAAIVAAADRAAPAVVVLWTTIRRSGQSVLRRRVEGHGHQVLTAGPGWLRPDRDLDDLDAAVAQVIDVYRTSARQRTPDHTVV